MLGPALVGFKLCDKPLRETPDRYLVMMQWAGGIEWNMGAPLEKYPAPGLLAPCVVDGHRGVAVEHVRIVAQDIHWVCDSRHMLLPLAEMKKAPGRPGLEVSKIANSD